MRTGSETLPRRSPASCLRCDAHTRAPLSSVLTFSFPLCLLHTKNYSFHNFLRDPWALSRRDFVQMQSFRVCARFLPWRYFIIYCLAILRSVDNGPLTGGTTEYSAILPALVFSGVSSLRSVPRSGKKEWSRWLNHNQLP